MSGALQSSCCETCRNIRQETSMKEFTKKNSLTRQMLFWNVSSNLLSIKEIFDEAAVGSRFALFDATYIYIYIYIYSERFE